MFFTVMIKWYDTILGFEVYEAHTMSRSHISIAGSMDPTAIKFPVDNKHHNC